MWCLSQSGHPRKSLLSPNRARTIELVLSQKFAALPPPRISRTRETVPPPQRPCNRIQYADAVTRAVRIINRSIATALLSITSPKNEEQHFQRRTLSLHGHRHGTGLHSCLSMVLQVLVHCLRGLRTLAAESAVELLHAFDVVAGCAEEEHAFAVPLDDVHMSSVH